VSGASGIARGAADMTAAGVSRLGQTAGVDSGNDINGSVYLVDTLFRPAKPGDEGNVGESRAEAMRILSRSFQNGNVTLAPRMQIISRRWSLRTVVSARQTLSSGLIQ
jgi:hypothetical protein